MRVFIVCQRDTIVFKYEPSHQITDQMVILKINVRSKDVAL